MQVREHDLVVIEMAFYFSHFNKVVRNGLGGRIDHIRNFFQKISVFFVLIQIFFFFLEVEETFIIRQEDCELRDSLKEGVSHALFQENNKIFFSFLSEFGSLLIQGGQYILWRWDGDHISIIFAGKVLVKPIKVAISILLVKHKNSPTFCTL